MAASYITLPECRAQANIKDDTFTEDDLYLQWLAEAAEITVAKRLNHDLNEFEDEDGRIPLTLKLACWFYVATWYKNRENTIEGTITSQNLYAADDILQDYLSLKIG